MLDDASENTDDPRMKRLRLFIYLLKHLIIKLFSVILLFVSKKNKNFLNLILMQEAFKILI
jgi:hypothetical protein